MFCNKCGTACDDQAQFCNACGNSLQAAPQVPEQPAQPAYQPEYQAPAQPVYQPEYQAPAQPVYQPEYQAPVQPAYQQPVYQPEYQQPAYQQPAYPQPGYPQPAYQQPVRQPVVYKPLNLNVKTPLKKFSGVIAAILAVFALFMFVMATFGLQDLPVKLSVKGDALDDAYEMAERYADVETNVSTGKVYLGVGEIKDLYDMADEYELEKMADYLDIDLKIGSAAPLYIGNVLFGLICLAIAAIAGLYAMKKTSNSPLYDQLVGKLLKLEDPTFVVCGLGIVGIVLQNLLYLLAGSSVKADEAKAVLSMGVPTLTWVALFVFALVGAVNLVAQSKED